MELVYFTIVLYLDHGGEKYYISLDLMMSVLKNMKIKDFCVCSRLLLNKHRILKCNFSVGKEIEKHLIFHFIFSYLGYRHDGKMYILCFS